MFIAKRKPFLLFSPFMGGRRRHAAPDGAERSIELTVAIKISPLRGLPVGAVAVSEPGAVATGSYTQKLRFDPVATARGSDTGGQDRGSNLTVWKGSGSCQYHLR